MKGFEPLTAGATVRSSTTELHPPCCQIITFGSCALGGEIRVTCAEFAALKAACGIREAQFSEQPPPPIPQQLLCPQPAAMAGALLLVLTENVESWVSSL